jgi:hypothetical protein
MPISLFRTQILVFFLSIHIYTNANLMMWTYIVRSFCPSYDLINNSLFEHLDTHCFDDLYRTYVYTRFDYCSIDPLLNICRMSLVNTGRTRFHSLIYSFFFTCPLSSSFILFLIMHAMTKS